MQRLRILVLTAALALAGVESAHAGPMPALPLGAQSASADAVHAVALVCGPYRCFRRFGWRYGYGYGFRPFRRFGYGYRPFRFRHYGWRRW